LIPFTKAHACGNDFLIVPEAAVPASERAEVTRRLCARNSGIGADGIEFLAWNGKQGCGRTAGRIWLHNADGAIAEISGNGTRCVAAFMAHAVQARPGDEMHLETDAGTRLCALNSVAKEAGYAVDITMGMGVPTFALREVTLAAGMRVKGAEVSMGNPHFVIVVDDPDFAVEGQSWQSVGQEICFLPEFPSQTNVEFVRLRGQGEIEIRIFERGVGPTSSSGTGTSASATAAIAQGLAAESLRVLAPGGAQTVKWRGLGHDLFLTGPAALIAQGEAW
jgi:diaminopimelate epimerase